MENKVEKENLNILKVMKWLDENKYEYRVKGTDPNLMEIYSSGKIVERENVLI